MTLRELRKAYPKLFYRQTWFDGHAFMSKTPETIYLGLPTGVSPGQSPTVTDLPSAVELVTLYVNDPAANIWKNFLWTADKDDYDQPVYVGGVRGGRLEIHRHLTITQSWVTPVWR